MWNKYFDFLKQSSDASSIRIFNAFVLVLLTPLIGFCLVGSLLYWEGVYFLGALGIVTAWITSMVYFKVKQKSIEADASQNREPL